MADKFDTYWVTRDTAVDGTLSELVDVWLVAPVLVRLPAGGFCWVGNDATGMEQRYTQWTIETTKANCYTYPETGRESIRVGA